MAGVPSNFQSISPVIANYDFVDIASGTGYINFYAGKTVDKNLLSNNVFYSDTVFSTTTYTTDPTLIYDVDFDVVLNRPLDVRGLGIVNVSIGLTNNTGTPSVTGGYIVATLRKYSGSESDIVTNTSRAVSVNTTTLPYYEMLAIDLDIPLTHFKPGDTLRLTIQMYGTGTGGTKTAGFGHDPANRTSTWSSVGSILQFQCPVRLNL